MEKKLVMVREDHGFVIDKVWSSDGSLLIFLWR